MTDNQAAQLHYELNLQLTKAIPTSVIALSINALIVTLVFWSVLTIKLVGIWLLTLLMLNIVRFYQYKSFQNSNKSATYQKAWLRRFSILTLLTALCWSFTTWSFFIVDEPYLILFLVFVIAGISAGSIVVLSAALPLAISYLAVILIPLSARFFYSGSKLDYYMGILVLVYLALNIKSAKQINRNLVDNIELTGRAEINKRLLAKTTHAALKAAQVKSEFLANMSHEIRTPLHGIIGTLLLLDQSKLDEKSIHLLETANSSANNLLHIINDILDVSKIEAGHLILDTQRFSMRDVIEKVCLLYSSSCRQKNIDIQFFQPLNMVNNLNGDAFRVQQILNNLVGNALKFTDHGGIYIRCSAQQQDTRSSMVTIEVIDTGIGIDPVHKATLFESFQQADASTSRKYGGSGLGLTICKKLVEAMHGEIGIDDSVNKGSRFWFSIPFTHAEQPRMDKENNAQTTLRIALLTADDFLEKIFVDYCAYSAIEFDNIIDTSSLASQNYDFIFVDCKHAAHANIENNDDLRIIEIDGQANEHRTQINRPIFISTLNDILTGQSTEVHTSLPIHTEQQYSGKILLVEDNEINQMVSSEIMRKLGLYVEIVDNGADAVEIVKTNHFDLVFMDCQMPIMDGYTATQRIRINELHSTSHLTIIALTANVMQHDQEKCLASGMDGFLGKPFTIDDLTTILQKWLYKTSESEMNVESQGIQ